MMNTKLSFILMYISFFVYSFASIFSKLASMQTFLSAFYFFCFCGIIFVLGIYAILWQQILRIIPISVAMANKPIALILSLVWAALFFGEQFSLKMIGGIFLVLLGSFIVGLEVSREK